MVHMLDVTRDFEGYLLRMEFHCELDGKTHSIIKKREYKIEPTVETVASFRREWTYELALDYYSVTPDRWGVWALKFDTISGGLFI